MRASGIADEAGGVVCEEPHPAIETVAAVNVVVADGLHGDGFPAFDDAAAIGGH